MGCYAPHQAGGRGSAGGCGAEAVVVMWCRKGVLTNSKILDSKDDVVNRFIRSKPDFFVQAAVNASAI